MKKSLFNPAAIAVCADGRVVLSDADLLALEVDFTATGVAGAANESCTNAGCRRETNETCQNNLCGGNTNMTCVNIGGSCMDLHVMVT